VYIFLNELCEACKCIKLYTCIGGLHTVLHSRTAGQLTWKTQNAPKFFAAGASPQTQWESSQRSRKAHSWWRGAVSPLSKNAGPLAQPFGIRVLIIWASPRPRNVDFVTTPLHSRNLVRMNWPTTVRKILDMIVVCVALRPLITLLCCIRSYTH